MTPTPSLAHVRVGAGEPLLSIAAEDPAQLSPPDLLPPAA
jgi:hypothetical protein